MNRGLLGVDTDLIDCETALPVLVSRYVVNGGCFGVDTDWTNCKSSLPVLDWR